MVGMAMSEHLLKLGNLVALLVPIKQLLFNGMQEPEQITELATKELMILGFELPIINWMGNNINNHFIFPDMG